MLQENNTCIRTCDITAHLFLQFMGTWFSCVSTGGVVGVSIANGNFCRALPVICRAPLFLTIVTLASILALPSLVLACIMSQGSRDRNKYDSSIVLYASNLVTHVTSYALRKTETIENGNVAAMIGATVSLTLPFMFYLLPCLYSYYTRTRANQQAAQADLVQAAGQQNQEIDIPLLPEQQRRRCCCF